MAKALDFLGSDDESSSKQPSSSSRNIRPTKGKGKAKSRTSSAFLEEQANGRDQNQDDDEDGHGDAAFIAAAMTKANKKAGTDVAKAAAEVAGIKAKGKGKVNKNKVASITKGTTGGGSFQSMGLHPSLLRSLLIRGYTNPTPIQRLAIPSLLETPPRDLVGMARTGSGKTLAYLIPLLHSLNGVHSSTFGIKALVMAPSRELALQILKVGKEIARGWKTSAPTTTEGEAQVRSEGLRWGLIVGGESLDEQFELISNNPDILIATPGRLLHLCVEMNLNLSSVRHVIFDEADRLFELGFAEQLTELLSRLPDSSKRQTALFSATLPKSLVEFARAGLGENPKLLRLDSENKVGKDLATGFFSIKPSEKEAALLILLREIIGVPVGGSEKLKQVHDEMNNDLSSDDDEEEGKRKSSNSWSKGPKQKGFSQSKSFKRKRDDDKNLNNKVLKELHPWQTIIFCATKHHVEYLLLLLTTAGYTCSHLYSSLDQATRGQQMQHFRTGRTNLLIVTDVAARGIDLPVLEHVVNYDMPTQPRVFVHRVGRTARAGRRGYAWSLVTNKELPQLCELQLFLDRPLIQAHIPSSASSKSKSKSRSQDDVHDGEETLIDLYTSLPLGTFPRSMMDFEQDYVQSSILNSSSNASTALPALREVVGRAQDRYEKSCPEVAKESKRRARSMIKGDLKSSNSRLGNEGEDSNDGKVWILAGGEREEEGVSDLIKRPELYGLGARDENGRKLKSAAADEDGMDEEESKERKKRELEELEVLKRRDSLLATINSFRPAQGETVLELSGKGKAVGSGKIKNVKGKESEGSRIMKERRKKLDEKIHSGEKRKDERSAKEDDDDEEEDDDDDDDDEEEVEDDGLDGLRPDEIEDLEQADEEDIEDVFGAQPKKKARTSETGTSSKVKGRKDYRDPDFYMDYEQKGAKAERGYNLNEGPGPTNFTTAASSLSFSLTNDDTGSFGTQSQRVNASRWDTKKKKFVRGDGTGSDNKKLIRTESGGKLPASFRSGRFDEWSKSKKLELPRVGDQEIEGRGRNMNSSRGSSRGGRGGGNIGGGRGGYRHNSFTAPKNLDPKQHDYHKKLKARNEKAAQQNDGDHGSYGESSRGGRGGNRNSSSSRGSSRGGRGASRGGRGGRTVGGRSKNEVKSAMQIQKERALKEKRREKNARPSKKGRGGGGRGKGRR